MTTNNNAHPSKGTGAARLSTWTPEEIDRLTVRLDAIEGHLRRIALLVEAMGDECKTTATDAPAGGVSNAIVE